MLSIDAALASLGSTSQEIAVTLLTSGCSSDSIAPNSCPVAKFLQQKTGNPNLLVGYFHAYTQEEGGELSILPTPVQEFIRDLEDKKYPLLYS